MSDSPAIPAATLIVVRERSSFAPELLMVERAQGMAFAGGALVFPGGRIDPADRSLGKDEMDAARTAAIRETLEETAIPAALDPVPGKDTALGIQRALLEDRDFGALLGKYNLTLDLDALAPFARWVPKFHAVRRFDTLFFLARAPGEDWEPNICDGECSAAVWISAADALARDRDGSARLIFPTRRNLERLALHANFDAMLDDARGHPVEPISPWVEEMDGEKFITIPEGLGYPVTREKLEGLWRG